MKYRMLVLDLDGTLTNSKKEITEPTKKALLEIQEAGRIIVLASGRPINGVIPLAKELKLKQYGGYMLSFNGARITQCSTGKVVYNCVLPPEVVKPIYDLAKEFSDVDIVTYDDKHILSGISINKYTRMESVINNMEIIPIEYFVEKISFPVNKLLIPGEPAVLKKMIPVLKKKFQNSLNIYLSEPFFLEIMPQNIDKAYSLGHLLKHIGLTTDSVICCGDGYNDVSMIEFAGLGVAMENAQTVVKEKADFITKSNDNDGVLHVINMFLK